MTTAITSDRCRKCGRTIYHREGCPMEFICDDCCEAAGHQHKYQVHTKRETVMKSIRSFMTSIGRGFVGSFHRNRAGRIVCAGTAVKSDLPAYVKLACSPPPADALPLTEKEMNEAARVIAAQTVGQDSSGLRTSAQDSEPIDWTGKSK